jgi:hypothetical protein
MTSYHFRQFSAKKFSAFFFKSQCQEPFLLFLLSKKTPFFGAVENIFFKSQHSSPLINMTSHLGLTLAPWEKYLVLKSL